MKFPRISQLIHEESKILPDKISFFDHWGKGMLHFLFPPRIIVSADIVEIIALSYLISCQPLHRGMSRNWISSTLDDMTNEIITESRHILVFWESKA